MPVETAENTERREGFVPRTLGLIEVVLAACAGLSIAAIMFVVVADVTMRYFVHEPLGWSYDLIGSYLMVCVFFFALSDTLNHHGHIAIDIFAHALPRRVQFFSMLIGYAVAAFLMAMVSWQGWLRFEAAYAANNLISTTVPWPTWPSYMLVTIGAGLITLRCAVRGIGHAASLVTGREYADMPPPPTLSATDGEHGE